MTDMYRITLSLTEAQEKKIFELRKTDKFCRSSVSDILRYLINQALETPAVKNVK